MNSNGAKTCPMCTQANAFSSSLNDNLSSSIMISKRDDIYYLNLFVSTKEETPRNIGGTGFGIKFCPWCGRELDVKINR